MSEIEKYVTNNKPASIGVLLIFLSLLAMGEGDLFAFSIVSGIGGFILIGVNLLINALSGEDLIVH